MRDADPEEADGLYDTATHMYGHFYQDRPRGVRMGKISKVLHLQYPALVPILDSQVVKAYKTAARSAAKSSRRWTNTHRHLYWAAIRDDLIGSADDLNDLRTQLRKNNVLNDFARLTDLRILDALTWRPR